MRELLTRIYNGSALGFAETEQVFGHLVQGKLSEAEIAALLIALKIRGEQPDEIAGAARALRESARDFPVLDYPVADCCGTGGDGCHTINVSTAAAFVLAELGVPVAKHGNRSVSSKSGSADVLEQLGVKVEQSPSVAARCLEELRICFLFAPSYHKGMRFAMPVRKMLATRTIFNLLGPLVNPAAPAVQLVGVYAPELTKPLAEALGMLGVKTALVAHGSGLDEIAIHGKTVASLYRDGSIQDLEIDPKDFGLEYVPIDALRGGSPEENALAVRAILEGRGALAHNRSVAMNAGAALWLYGKARDLRDGFQQALCTIESGTCANRLAAFKELSHGSSDNYQP